MTFFFVFWTFKETTSPFKLLRFREPNFLFYFIVLSIIIATSIQIKEHQKKGIKIIHRKFRNMTYEVCNMTEDIVEQIINYIISLPCGTEWFRAILRNYSTTGCILGIKRKIIFSRNFSLDFRWAQAKKLDFNPTSKSTMWRLVEVQKTTQRKL